MITIVSLNVIVDVLILIILLNTHVTHTIVAIVSINILKININILVRTVPGALHSEDVMCGVLRLGFAGLGFRVSSLGFRV